MLRGYTLVIIQQIANRISRHRPKKRKSDAIFTSILVGFGINNVRIIEKTLEKIKIDHLILLFF